MIRWIEEDVGIVVDEACAYLDQAERVKSAYELGYANIALTVALPEAAETIRGLCLDGIIFVVHVTGLSLDEAKIFAASGKPITSCVSKKVREIAGRRLLMQAGVAIPIIVLMGSTKGLIIDKLPRSNKPVPIKSTKLPALGDQRPDPLVRSLHSSRAPRSRRSRKPDAAERGLSNDRIDRVPRRTAVARSRSRFVRVE